MKLQNALLIALFNLFASKKFKENINHTLINNVKERYEPVFKQN